MKKSSSATWSLGDISAPKWPNMRWCCLRATWSSTRMVCWTLVWSILWVNAGTMVWIWADMVPETSGASSPKTFTSHLRLFRCLCKHEGGRTYIILFVILIKSSESSEIAESDSWWFLYEARELYNVTTRLLKTSGPQDFLGTLSMIYPHELFGVIYTHYNSFFFKYIAAAPEIINKFWTQVAGAKTSYVAAFSFGMWFLWVWVWLESHPHMCILICILINSAKVRHNSNPTRNLLAEIWPRCCLCQCMVMGHPLAELGNPGREWAISFLGNPCSWLQATVNCAGSWFLWSMLTWGAQILCLIGLMILWCVVCLSLLTSKIMFISVRLHTYVFFSSSFHRCAKLAKHTMNVAFDKMRWSFAALLEGKWPALDWLGKPIDYSKRIGEAHGVHFVLGLQSYEP